MGKNNKAIQTQIDLSTKISNSQIERFDLFTIIVLGEIITSVIHGVSSHHHITLQIALLAGFGMLIIAIGLWWLYFDVVSHRQPKKGHMLTWSFLHLPLKGAIAICGAAILIIVKHDTTIIPVLPRGLLVGSIAIFFTLSSITNTYI